MKDIHLLPEKVQIYKYVGIVLDNALNINTTAEFLAKSGGKTFGAIYSKFKSNKGLGYETYRVIQYWCSPCFRLLFGSLGL